MMAHLHMRPSEPKPFNQPVSSRCRYTTPSDPKLSDLLLLLIIERFLRLHSHSSLAPCRPYCWYLLPLLTSQCNCAGFKSDGLFDCIFFPPSFFPFNKNLFVKFLLSQNPKKSAFIMFPQKAVNSKYSNYVTVKLPICLKLMIPQTEGAAGARFPACADKSRKDLTCANVPTRVAELLLGI